MYFSQRAYSREKASRVPLRLYENWQIFVRSCCQKRNIRLHYRKPMSARLQPSYRTRSSLLSRIKDWHDCDSWQQFYDTYSGLIFGTAMNARLTAEEAEEVLQETIL